MFVEWSLRAERRREVKSEVGLRRLPKHRAVYNMPRKNVIRKLSASHNTGASQPSGAGSCASSEAGEFLVSPT